ncbi:MAG: SRPBCC domain-containing protein [Candidatus Dormiibacterota bacterium]
MSDKNTVIQIDPATQEVVLTRTFDAPRELVFRAYTDPQLLPRWWGPRA